MKNRALAMIVAAIMMIGAVACAAGLSEEQAKDDLTAFYDAVDVKYSRALMDELLAFTTNEDLGFKTAGSQAELDAADFLVEELTKIGVPNVTKEACTIDTFVFKNADLSFTDANGEACNFEMAMFQTTYAAENEEVEIVYAGEGTDADYEGLDAGGKIVLIDINQVDNWWINWPAYQAKVMGAKAVIAVNNEGYCSYSEDTVGVQDFCGPSDAPAFAISVAQADVLKQAIEANGGAVNAVLNADAVVEHDGVGYNIIGEIPGKSDRVIYLLAHYDTYFRAFADNTSGVAAVMGITKALIDSGYTPEKTIRICLHCAEEWGVDDSRYDWARGSTLLVQSHPEWKDTAYMAINIDSGVIAGDAEGVEINAPYELSGEVAEIGNAIAIEGKPFEGALEVTSPAWTWTESFGYTVAGIPVMDSGLYGTDHTGTYHSNYDTEEGNLYDESIFEYCQKLYGAYLIAYDKQTVRAFDYTRLISEMKDSVNADIIENADALNDAFDKANTAAVSLNDKQVGMTGAEDAETFNSAMNDLFKDVSCSLFTLDWAENFQFVHSYKQTNVECLTAAIEALEAGDAETALECVWGVDLNWYASAFDKATCDYFVGQVLREDAKNSWGEGYLSSHADLWEVVRSLGEKCEAGDADLNHEIEVLKAELEVQKADLAAVVETEIASLNRIAETMETIAQM